MAPKSTFVIEMDAFEGSVGVLSGRALGLFSREALEMVVVALEWS